MTEGRTNLSGRLIFGIIVLVLGVLWTLDNLDVVDADTVLHWWGVVPLVWGAMIALGIGCPRRVFAGSLWMVAGAVALLHAAGLVSFSVFELWPILFIFVGANIVFRSWKGGSTPWGHHVGEESGETIRTFALMSGNEHKVTSSTFRGGSVDAMMGGVTVDLRAATPAEGRAVIDLFAMWGGIEIVVPLGWRVQSEVTAVMGGYEDSSTPTSDATAPLLLLRGFVVMGGVEVKNAPSGRKGVVIVHTDEKGERTQRKEVRLEGGAIVIKRESRPGAEPGAGGATGTPVEPE